jgi:hypothetical protein
LLALWLSMVKACLASSRELIQSSSAVATSFRSSFKLLAVQLLALQTLIVP